jgi:peptidoglycan/LPS O-acetylase OafA/YrhL
MGEPGSSYHFPVLDLRLPGYVPGIDHLKAFAILSVIVMHTFPTETVLGWGAPYYLWQAVPLFILIAGFTGAYGFRKRDSVSLGECYDPAILARRYSRLLVPFVLVWVLEAIIALSFQLVPLNGWSLAASFLSGGWGWGSYFIPVIFQSLLVVPLLYFVARSRGPGSMIGIALGTNIAFEAIVALAGNLSLSSFLYPRYLLAGALGVWLVTSTGRHRAAVLVTGVAGFVYLTLISYTAVFPSTSIFYRYDGALQFPSYAWTLLLAIAGLKYLPCGVTSRITRAVAGIGKASWHIFLFQTFYFLIPAGSFYALFTHIWSQTFGEIAGPPLFGFLSIPELSLYLVVLLVNMAICVGVGYAWHSAGEKLSGRLKGFLHAP